MTKLVHAAAAMALTLTSNAIMADEVVPLSAQGTMYGFQITLTDLDKSDGISPTIEFNNPPAVTTTAEVGRYDDFPDTGVVDQRSGVLPASVNATITGGDASASVSRSGGLSTTVLSTSALATADNTATSATAKLGGAGYWDGMSFTVSAHTEVTFSAIAVLQGGDVPGYGSRYANAELEIYDDQLNVQSGMLATASSDPSAPPSAQTLSVSWNNQSDTAQQANLLAYLGVDATWIVAATTVPEPGNVTLLLTGIAALAFMARRHKA